MIFRRDNHDAVSASHGLGNLIPAPAAAELLPAFAPSLCLVADPFVSPTPAPIAPPIVSIITPYYKAAATIRDTARSILAQSLRNFEWIIVDDGCPLPESPAVLQSIADADPRVLIIRQPNSGPGAARNTGAAHSAAPYIAFFDADDIAAPTFLEKAVITLEALPSVEWVYAGIVCFGTTNFLWQDTFRPRSIASGNQCSIMSVVRREAHEAIGGFSTLRARLEDWDYWVRLTAEGYSGWCLREPLVLYRANSTGIHATLESTIAAQGEELRTAHEATILARHPVPPRQHFDTWRFPEDTPWSQTLETGPAHDAAEPHVMVITNFLDVGGAEQFLLSLLQQLAQRRVHHSVVLTTNAEHHWLHRAYATTRDVFPLANMIDFADPYQALLHLIQSRRPDILFVTQSIEALTYLPLLARRFPHMKLVTYLHSETQGWRNGGFPGMSATLASLWDKVYVNSHQLRNSVLQAMALREEQAEVFRTGIDFRRFDPARYHRAQERTTLHFAESDLVVGHISRLTDEKNPAALLRIFIRLCALDPRVRILVVGGDDGARQNFYTQLEAAGVGHRARILPDATDMPRYYACMDCFVLPSTTEGTPIVAIEAAAFGVPCVASHIGGVAEIVHGAVGVTVAPPIVDGDIEPFVAAVLEQLRHDSPARRSARREQVLKEFNVDNTVGMLAQALRKLAEAETAPRHHSRNLDDLCQLARWLAFEYRTTKISDHHWLQLRLQQLSEVQRLKQALADCTKAFARKVLPKRAETAVQKLWRTIRPKRRN